jgi:hypothetical protein
MTRFPMTARLVLTAITAAAITAGPWVAIAVIWSLIR